MSGRARLIEGGLLAAGASLFAAQLACTWQDRNRWPLCSYNMFNRVLPERLPQPRVRLQDGDGPTVLLPVYGMMPLEFFRVVPIFGAIFLDNADEGVKARFARRVLDRMNDHPWRAFDEVRASYRPRSGRFTGLDVYEVWADLAEFDSRADGPWQDERLLYSYRSEPCERR